MPQYILMPISEKAYCTDINRFDLYPDTPDDLKIYIQDTFNMWYDSEDNTFKGKYFDSKLYLLTEVNF